MTIERLKDLKRCVDAAIEMDKAGLMRTSKDAGVTTVLHRPVFLDGVVGDFGIVDLKNTSMDPTARAWAPFRKPGKYTAQTSTSGET